MRRTTGKMVVLSLVLLLSVVVGSATACAIEEQSNATRKFARGWANILTSFLEIPLKISQVYKEDGIVAATFWGTSTGIRAAVARSAVGVMEVLTFPFAFRDVGYDPIVQPEFLLSPREQ